MTVPYIAHAYGVPPHALFAAVGLPPDARSYDLAAQLLDDLGLTRVRLLTNNWEKVAGLEAHGIKVEREPLVVPTSDRARPYLESKRARGHALG